MNSKRSRFKALKRETPPAEKQSLAQRLRRWRSRPVESLHEYLEPPSGHSLEEVEEPLEIMRRPARTDPRHADESVPAGQDDVPAGGTTGEEMRGGGKHPCAD